MGDLDLPDLSPLRRRHAELEARLGDPATFADPRTARDLAREHQRLGRTLALGDEAARLAAELAGLDEMAAGDDAELRDLALAERDGVAARLAKARDELRSALVPPDPGDSRNTIVEIRAGAGGDEASLFAAELARLYVRYAERRGWKVEPLATAASEAGGLRETSFLVRGEDVYRRLKFESGVHRVQRVPVTEANGRIHTSTATVAVLPEAEEVDIELREDDLEITVSRASGPGGQGVNTSDSAVQIVHKPTGLLVTCADERSQLRNRERARAILRARLLARREEEERAKYAAHRRSLVGTGDRSERIRTYNFPQSRLTDHRIGLTQHNLDAVLEGDIDSILDALAAFDLEERLAAIGAEGGPR